MRITQYKTYKATIDYHRTDDLKPESLKNGSEILIEALWIADKEENYAGDWIFMPAIAPHWLPERDLKILQEIDREEYINKRDNYINGF